MFLFNNKFSSSSTVVHCFVGVGFLICVFSCRLNTTYTVVIRKESRTGNGTIMYKIETIKAGNDSDAYKKGVQVFTASKKRDVLFGVNGKMMRTISFKVLDEKERDISKKLAFRLPPAA